MYYGLLSLAAKVPAAGYDSDAQAFFTAAGITDTTQKSAVNQLVLDLKSYSIWTKMKALYPMVGGTSTTHSYNLINTAQYQLTFNGGWTHSSTGALPNGTNGYANTGLTPSAALNLDSSHLSYYSRINVSDSAIEIGCKGTGDHGSLIACRYGGTAYFRINTLSQYLTYSESDSRAFYIANRTGSVATNAFRNSIKVATYNYTSSALTSQNIVIGAWNDTGSITNFSTKECALASIGDGLTDTEAANFYTAVQTFQTTLGRQVGVPIVSDADAQAFLNAAVITDTTQASAINTLVTGLKTDGLWTKMKAIYPFVGGTASTHKWNLKNPVDSDAAFRLVFSGGLTHDSNGIKGNATNGYYDTKFNPSVQLTSTTGGSAFFYCNNSVADNGSDLAANQSGVNTRFQVMSSYAGSFYASMLATNLYSAANTTTVGFFGATREPSNTTSFYAVKDTNSYSYSDSFANPNSNVAGLCVCTDSTSFAYFTGRRHSFSCMGEGLTTTEAQNLRSRVITFNTTLGR